MNIKKEGKPCCDLRGSKFASSELLVLMHDISNSLPVTFRLFEFQDTYGVKFFPESYSSPKLFMTGVIESGFVRGEERWEAVESTGRSVAVNYNAVTQSLAVSAPGRDKVYFRAPGECSSGFCVTNFSLLEGISGHHVIYYILLLGSA